jgi:type II secretory pathway component GspD/PulD (secretin)
MKTLKLHLISSACVLGLLVTAAAQSDTPPANQQSAQPADTNAVALQDTSQPAQGEQTAQAPRRFGPGTNLSELVAANVIPPASAGTTGGGVRTLNLVNMPLQEVLQTLADAAGFVIRSRGVSLQTRISLITAKPMSREELVKQLNTVLSENLYGAYLQEDGMLLIDSMENIKRATGRVVREANPEIIPVTDEIVTQSLPIKYVDANQLSQTLQSLLPSGMSLIVSAGGNAIVVQDTSAHIHRMAEIIRILDVPLAVSAVVKVYALTNADAKSLAAIIQNVFQSAGSRGGGGVTAVGGGGAGGFANPIAQMFGLGGGAGVGDGAGGGGGGGVGVVNGQGRVSAPPVTATSDDRSNMLVVSAAAEQIVQIDKLVAQMDVNVDDVAEMRLFKLYYADPGETADELSTVFPNTTTGTQQQQNSGRGGVQFGGATAGNTASTTTQSERLLKQTQVIAVADYRTSSVIVIASKTLMPEIEKMIDRLDEDQSGAQQVFVWNTDNMDPSLVQQYLQDLFPSSSGNAGQNTSSQSSSIFKRSATGSSGTGTTTQNTGFGTGGGSIGGGTGGGGGFGG